MRSEKVEHQVVHQEIALDSYLSTLLEEIPEDIAVLEEVSSVTKVVEPVVTPVKVKARPKVVVEVKPTTVVKTKSKEVVKDEVENKTVDDKALSLKLENPMSVMPGWAQNEFQTLYFRVDKLILAAPLTDLLRVIEIKRLPTKIPGQPSWFMGLLDTHEQRIGVLDTGQLVFGRNRGQQRDLENNPFKSILISQDGRWGLACDEVLSISKLEPEKVRWRTLREKRPWLVGTVIDELTAVVDINQLVPSRKGRK